MAGNNTGRTGKLRELVCVLLAASLCAPLVSTGCPVELREQPVQLLALAGSSAPILLNRGGPRADQARQGTAVASPYIILPPQSHAPDGGRLARALEEAGPQPRLGAEAQSGRSPPIAIS